MGLTQRQVSDIYRIPYSTIQKWEHGICVPPDYVLRMMWEIYNLRNVNDIIERSNT
jgi:DNA-binding transcriptional regulator YiaG